MQRIALCTSRQADLLPRGPWGRRGNVILELCKGVYCVDLGESFQTHIFLQNFASIQPRTSPVKFAASRAGSASPGGGASPGGPAAGSLGEEERSEDNYESNSV